MFRFLVLASSPCTWRPANARFLTPMAAMVMFPPPLCPVRSCFIHIRITTGGSRPLVLRPTLPGLLSLRPRLSPLFACVSPRLSFPPVLRPKVVPLPFAPRAFVCGEVVGSCEMEAV